MSFLDDKHYGTVVPDRKPSTSGEKLIAAALNRIASAIGQHNKMLEVGKRTTKKAGLPIGPSDRYWPEK